MQKLLQNKILLTIGGVIAGVLFLVVAYMLTSSSQPTLYPNVNKIKADDHLKWSKDKKVILVEYSDLQCPACKGFHDYIRQGIETPKNGEVDLTKKVTLIYRQFPLTTIHQNALQAAYASEAAAKQGKFFEFADKTFDTQSLWEKLSNSDVKSYFADIAKSLKLNVDEFKKDMDSDEVKNRVQEDQQSAGEAEVNATPTFFLNGEKLDLQSYDQLKQLLTDAVNKAK